jgi:hypothetical protein
LEHIENDESLNSKEMARKIKNERKGYEKLRKSVVII